MGPVGMTQQYLFIAAALGASAALAAFSAGRMALAMHTEGAITIAAILVGAACTLFTLWGQFVILRADQDADDVKGIETNLSDTIEPRTRDLVHGSDTASTSREQPLRPSEGLEGDTHPRPAWSTRLWATVVAFAAWLCVLLTVLGVGNLRDSLFQKNLNETELAKQLQVQGKTLLLASAAAMCLVVFGYRQMVRRAREEARGK